MNNIDWLLQQRCGRDSLQAATAGSENNAFGDEAMFNVTTGGFNTAFGDDALDDHHRFF